MNGHPAAGAVVMTDVRECAGATVFGNASDSERSDMLRLRASEPAVLSVYVQLIDRFARAGVAWCYWKSRRRAADALCGQTDLDIVVTHTGRHDARRVLLECGFKALSPVTDRADLSVECYFNHDEPSGLIARVDLHTRLALGGALFKTHRLPWEHSLIGRAERQPGSRLPLLDPASEAVLLVVRASLELRWHDPVKAWSWSATTRKFALDRSFLTTLVDRKAVRERAAELLDEAIAASIAAAFFDPRPLQSQRDLRRRIRKAVAHFRTHSCIEGATRAVWRGLHAAWSRLNRHELRWPRPWNRRVTGGGIVVAVIAVDGAGKSTLVRGICGWLGQEVDVLPLYFGTGDGRPSWLLAPLKMLVPLVSMLLPRKPKGSSHGIVTRSAPGFVYSLLLAIWAAALAVEKRIKLRAAHRAANRGMLVIADRFPQDEIPDFNDGPLLPRLRYVPRWLRAFEASAYALARELRPDVVIKLVASPELIALREPTMDLRVIQARTEAVGRLKLGDAPITAISAAQPVADVLRAAKVTVWRAL
jgi:hypothetical protein